MDRPVFQSMTTSAPLERVSGSLMVRVSKAREATPTPGSDVDVQFRYPYPVAVAYRATRTSGVASECVLWSFRAIENLFRFLALTNLADMLARPGLAVDLPPLVARLERPTMGAWLDVLKESTRKLRGAGSPFLGELAGALLKSNGKPTPLLVDMESAIENRNHLTHTDVVLTEAQARPELARIRPLVEAVFQGLSFLCDYRLGHVAAGKRYGLGFQYSFYPLAGLEELGEPLRLTGGALPPEGLPIVIGPAGHALWVWPFFRWSLCSNDQTEHLLLLASADQSAQPSRYTHPRLRHTVEALIQDPDAPEEDCLTWREAIEKASALPLLLDLKLDESSRRSLDLGSAAATHDLFDNRFRFLGVLGRGGMGVVYRALDTRLERVRALKLLRRDMLHSARETKRFFKEGELLARLEDAAFARVYDVGIDAATSTPYIVMDEIVGCSLQQILDDTGPIATSEAIEITAQCLGAVQKAHDVGIIHRDLKPSNVMRRDDGSLCLLDFGIAVDPSRATRLSVVSVGTPGYIAPECVAGQPTYASDQFGAAQMFRTLVTGAAPTEQRAELDSLGEAVRQVLIRALATDPAQRWPSARAMGAALRAGVELDSTSAVAARRPARRGANLAEALERAHGTLPWPVASAVDKLGTSDHDGWTRVRVFEALVEYLATLAVVEVIHAPDDQVDLQLALKRPTLGRRLQIFNATFGPSSGRSNWLLPGLRRIAIDGQFVPSADLLLRLRNELAHGAGGATPEGDAGDSELCTILRICEGLNEHELVLDGVRLVGASPFLWNVSVSPSLRLRTDNGVVDPWPVLTFSRSDRSVRVLDRLEGGRLIFSGACGDHRRVDPARHHGGAVAEQLPERALSSREFRVRVCGSSSDDAILMFCASLGRCLAEHSAISLIGSDGRNVGAAVSTGFTVQLGGGERLIPVGAAGTPTEAIRDANALVFVGGSDGTQDEFDLATRLGVQSVIVDQSGGTSDRLARSSLHANLHRVVRLEADADEAARQIVALLSSLARPQQIDVESTPGHDG